MLSDLLNYAGALLLICLLAVAWAVIAFGYYLGFVSMIGAALLCVPATLATFFIVTFIGEELL